MNPEQISELSKLCLAARLMADLCDRLFVGQVRREELPNEPEIIKSIIVANDLIRQHSTRLQTILDGK